MARARLIIATAIVTAITVNSVPTLAGGMAVFDSTNWAEAKAKLAQMKKDFDNQVKQLKTATDTLKEVNQVREGVEEVGNAIGEVATFKIPVPRVDKMISRFRNDLQCLLPDRPSYGFIFEDFVQASFCDLAVKYRESLFAEVEDMTGLTLFEQDTKRAEVEKNRDALLADSVIQALSGADVVANKSAEMNTAISDLENLANSSETLQAKIAATNKLLALHNQQQADTNLLLARTLKLQAAMFTQMGLQADSLKPADEKSEGNK